MCSRQWLLAKRIHRLKHMTNFVQYHRQSIELVCFHGARLRSFGTTVNGTAALHLACLTVGLQPGEEVIVPTLTYIATANVVAYCGATPVFADSDSNTWNVTVESVQRAWTDRTVGVIAVHLYGLPAPV